MKDQVVPVVGGGVSDVSVFMCTLTPDILQVTSNMDVGHTVKQNGEGC